MPDRWIITSHPYREHKTLERAQKELKRIEAQGTKRTFRIVRISTELCDAETMSRELQLVGDAS